MTIVFITKKICSKCNKSDFYVLKDETHVCRKCGNRWKESKELNSE